MAELKRYLKIGFVLFAFTAVTLFGAQTEASELSNFLVSLTLVQNSLNLDEDYSSIEQNQSRLANNPYFKNILLTMSSGKPEKDEDTEQPPEANDNPAEETPEIISDQADPQIDETPQPVIDREEPTIIVSQYTIGPGDLLSIRVFGEEDLSIPEIRVNGAGAISYPLLGEIKVLGYNPKKLEAHIAEMLQEGYLKDPQVTVSILQYRLFYVRGEVEKPGGYSYVAGLTIQKGIALAGGFTERASKSKISLVREDNPDEPMKSVGMNELVQPGDIITVGESLF